MALILAFMTVSITACGDTWRGLRKDTGENVQATGRAVERAGEAVKPQQ
jgi:predicted small secreted protein